MCETQDVMPRRKRMPPRAKGECHRCGGRSRFLVRSLALCRECFEKSMQGHMVKTLHPPLFDSKKAAPQRPPMQAGGVLLALSGGGGSTALLDLIGVGGYVGAGERDITKGEKMAVWREGWAVHVDFSGVVGHEERGSRLEAMARERGLEFVNVRAEEAFDPAFAGRLRELAGREVQWPEEGSSVVLSSQDLPLMGEVEGVPPLDALKSLLAALPPPSRPAMLQHVLDALLAAVAGALPVSHMLLGDTSTRDAARVIASTARGAGWSLPLELRGSTKMPNGVVRIKAMREASAKEAALWCHGRRLETSAERRWDAGGKSARGKEVASLEALTERFIAGLSVSHPATVTTVTKTAAKLSFMGEGKPLCPLCEHPVDDSATEWKRRAALTSLPGRGSATEAPAGADPLAPLLCYACLTTFTPLTAAAKDRPPSDAVPLPMWVGGRARQRDMSEEEMRAHISDHLL